MKKPDISATQFFSIRDALDAEVKAASARLKEVAGPERTPMGITPDSVKATPEWKAARRAFDNAFARSRTFNGRYVKHFKAEIRERIDASRKAAINPNTQTPRIP